MTTGQIRSLPICSAAVMPSMTGHLDVHDDDVGLELDRHRDGLLAVAGLADDVVAGLAEHLGEVEADHRLVLGHERRAWLDGSGRGAAWVSDSMCRERDLNPHALAGRGF